MTRLKIATALMIAAGIIVLLGTVSFFYGAGATGVGDVARGAWWYTTRRWETYPVLVVLLAITIVVGLVLAVLAARGWLRVRRGQVLEVGPAEPTVPDPEKQLQLIRKRLDRVLTRPRVEVERVLDALFGALVDNDADELVLSPGEMVVEVKLSLDGELRPLTSLSLPAHESVLKQLRLVTGVEEGEGQGVVELRSSRRFDLLAVHLFVTGQGVEVRMRLAAEGDLVNPAEGAAERRAPDGRLRRLRASPSTIMRLERSSLPDLKTGEIPVPVVSEHAVRDSLSGLLYGVNTTSELEVPPLMVRRSQRAVSPVEGWVRLAFAGAALVLSIAYFWQAYGWGLHKLSTGEASAPWRAVQVVVTAAPRAGEVFIQGQPVGRTPLTLTLPCKGEPLEVIVRAQGYRAWQWQGVCPTQGPLTLRAQLQPL